MSGEPTSPETWVIVNPKSGGGGTEIRLAALQTAATRVFGAVSWRVTAHPGHATDLAREACAAGATRIVAVGGDGTANEVVNGLFDGERPLRPSVVFGLVSSGTGGDLARTLRIPRDPEEAFQRVRDLPPVACDVLSVTCTAPDGSAVRRLGINVVGFGLNGEVVARANRSSKRFGGRVTFLAATIASFLEYRPPRVQVRWTDDRGGTGTWEGRLSTVFVANAQYCGGGMWVGRGGSMHDGAADLLVVPELPILRAIIQGRRLFSGTLGDVKEVSRTRVVQVEALADSETQVRMDVDGEQPGLLPVSIDVLRKVLLIAGQMD
jgi:diacylglycerol kinase (ATP)